ncbi:MAG TPA: hypothetical protein VMC06_10340, partial [Opitutaceae bacterium]|nr:hypothetical protein [Opitutaceae bacterium]
ASGAPSGAPKLLLMWATRNAGAGIEPDEVFRSISRFADYLVLLHNSQPKLPFFAWLEQEIPKWAPGPQGKAVRPALPEEARRLVVLAEQAAKDKQYTKAGDLYAEAIRLAPFWPACYYNAALVFAELNLHEQAIAFMSYYLQLNPDDPNARAIKDRIYLWSDKAAVPDQSWNG